MGIRGLTARLKKSAIEQRLGCSNLTCEGIPTKVVIDGPSLAYWIHSRLVAALTDNGDQYTQYTQPSYKLIQETTLTFLKELELHNVQILKIYFDGGLPVWKRPTRYSRLHQDFNVRKALRKQHRDGIRYVVESSVAIHVDELFNGHDATHQPHTTPYVPAFLVQSLIEALKGSKFSERIDLVPGEADPWCAALAQQHTALILSNDSDMVVYEIGPGSVSFINSLRRQRCELCHGHAITARVLQPTKILQEFSSPDMRHAAFKLQSETESVSLHGKTRTHKGISSHLTNEVSVPETLQDFSAHYALVDLDSGLDLQAVIKYMDPRLSEIVVQLRTSSQDPVISILPLLMDDPDRTSAWKISAAIRAFNYTLLMEGFDNGQSKALAEYAGRGQLEAKPKPVELLDKSRFIETTRQLLEMLAKIRKLVGTNDNSTIYWQSVCGIHVVYSHLASGRTTISELRSSLQSYLKDLSRGGIVIWSEIQLQAQLEATYYAFRQLQQTLRALRSIEGLPEPELLFQLEHAMKSLPHIVDISSPKGKLLSPKVNIDSILSFAGGMLDDWESVEE